MASKHIQQWIDSGEEVKAKLAVLIKTPLVVDTDAQPELDVTTDDTTDTRKRARKLTAVMQQSKEQEKTEKGNREDKAEKGPAKKRKKDGKKPEDSRSNTSNKENKNKQPKKVSSKSKSNKSKETRKQLTSIANKTAAEKGASTNAAQDIFTTFMEAFPKGPLSNETCKETNQVSLADSDHSDTEEETDGETAGELSFGMAAYPPNMPPNSATNIISTPRIMERQKKVPPSLNESTVTSPRIQQQKTSLVFQPRVPVTPSTSSRQLQELLPRNQSVSPTGRSGTPLSETAEIVARAMSSQLNDDDDCYQSGGFSDLLARPLSQDEDQEVEIVKRELIELREENSRLHDEIAMLRLQLNSPTRNQPS